MSFESHLAELEKKHGELDRKIEEAKAHPSVDDQTIYELKRRKLEIKDRIHELSESATKH